ncbi:MAG: hypothetical protein JEZ12_08780 [Desulfobacterium sp.]|nr:hypothetical protein [Desulfobacterium sp.]
MKKIYFALLVVFLTVNANPVSGNPARPGEIQKFLTMLESSSQKHRIDAAKLITRSGLSDPGLFNVINTHLLSEYNLHPTNQDHIDEMAWMCKALASSGVLEYKTTLEKIALTASSTKLKRYAQQSLDLVDENAENNRIMRNSSTSDSGLSPEINKYIGMLQSQKQKLKKDAAKSIFRGNYTEEKLFDVVHEELLSDYKNLSLNDRNGIDTMAWLCKALGSSGNKKYSKTLEQIVKETESQTLKRYAKKGLEMLD